MSNKTQKPKEEPAYWSRQFKNGLPVQKLHSAGIDVGDSKFDVVIAGKMVIESESILHLLLIY